jgi:HTH-type transcriptional regulator, glycine betaine synthesis regulator
LAKSSPVSAPIPIAFEGECVAFFAEIVQLFGIPKSVGQIYGLLYASPEPLGFTAIVECLEISKGSASQGLQLLRSLGAINEAEQKEGTNRGVLYEPELSLRQLVTGILRERIAPIAGAGADRLKHLKQLAVQSPAHAAFYLQRVSQLTTWSKRFKTVLPLLSALLGPGKKNSR